VSPESYPTQIRWTDEQRAFIEEARGEKAFSEFVRLAALEKAGKILRRKLPEVRGRGKPKKSAIDNS
jgi:hypothetical protein